METSLHYGQDKQLGFLLSECLTAAPGVQLKAKAHFNTVTGQLQHDGALRVAVSVGSAYDGSTPLLLSACACMLCAHVHGFLGFACCLPAQKQASVHLVRT